MKNISSGYRFLYALLFFFSIPSGAAISIATIEWCPYICPDSQDKPGLLVEYTREIYGDLPMELHFEVFPWSRAIKMVEEGKVDALLAPAKNEAPMLLYPQHEIGIQRFCFFNRSDDPWFYHDISSLKGRRIIYPKDALPTSFRNLGDQATMMAHPYNQSYLSTSSEILLKSRVDSFLMTYISVAYFLNQNNLSNKIRVAGCASEQNLYLAFSPVKSLQSKIQPLMAQFDANITVLRQQQFYKTLLQKYQVD